MRRAAPYVVVSLLAVVACTTAASSDATDAPGADAGTNETDAVGSKDDAAVAPVGDAGTADADAGPLDGPPPSILPVTYQRPDVGTPLTQAELQTATDELIALLKDTRYFDFVDERVHGWPKTDPNGGYWWGTFWSGVTVTKSGGTVTYKHSNDGTDNAGIYTSPYLESACWAHLLWGEAKTAELVRRIARGMIGWILAMQRTSADTTPTLLARAFYPPPVTSNEGGRSLFIDTSASRPGVDGATSVYLHHPNNPTLGDIYVKNKRSKDDIGHMLRAIAQIQACTPRFDAAASADIAQLEALYASWATDVDGRGFVIPTRQPDGTVVEPSDQLAHYTPGVECVGTAAVRLAHAKDTGNIDCGTGFSGLEVTAWPFLKNDARQIQRSHHAAAVVEAHRQLDTTAGLALLQGLGDRVGKDFDFASAPSPPSGFEPMDAVGFMAYAASVGVPLRSNEIRLIHAKLHDAYVGMRAPENGPTFDTFDASVPDGTYSFDPPTAGMFHRDVGLLLGSCASPYRNSAGRALLDCDRLVAAFKK